MLNLQQKKESKKFRRRTKRPRVGTEQDCSSNQQQKIEGIFTSADTLLPLHSMDRTDTLKKCHWTSRYFVSSEFSKEKCDRNK